MPQGLEGKKMEPHLSHTIVLLAYVSQWTSRLVDNMTVDEMSIDKMACCQA